MAHTGNNKQHRLSRVSTVLLFVFGRYSARRTVFYARAARGWYQRAIVCQQCRPGTTISNERRTARPRRLGHYRERVGQHRRGAEERTVPEAAVRVCGRDQRPGEQGAAGARDGAVRTGTRHARHVRPAAARLRAQDQRERFAQGVRERVLVRRAGEAGQQARRRRPTLVAAALPVPGAPGPGPRAPAVRRVRRGLPPGRAGHGRPRHGPQGHGRGHRAHHGREEQRGGVGQDQRQVPEDPVQRCRPVDGDTHQDRRLRAAGRTAPGRHRAARLPVQAA